MNWIKNLIAKYFGKSFITRAVTSLVSIVVGFIAGTGVVAPEVLNQFGESLGEVLVALAGLLLAWVLDGKFAKKEESK